MPLFSRSRKKNKYQKVGQGATPEPKPEPTDPRTPLYEELSEHEELSAPEPAGLQSKKLLHEELSEAEPLLSTQADSPEWLGVSLTPRAEAQLGTSAQAGEDSVRKRDGIVAELQRKQAELALRRSEAARAKATHEAVQAAEAEAGQAAAIVAAHENHATAARTELSKVTPSVERFFVGLPAAPPPHPAPRPPVGSHAAATAFGSALPQLTLLELRSLAAKLRTPRDQMDAALESLTPKSELIALLLPRLASRVDLASIADELGQLSPAGLRRRATVEGLDSPRTLAKINEASAGAEPVRLMSDVILCAVAKRLVTIFRSPTPCLADHVWKSGSSRRPRFRPESPPGEQPSATESAPGLRHSASRLSAQVRTGPESAPAELSLSPSLDGDDLKVPSRLSEAVEEPSPPPQHVHSPDVKTAEIKTEALVNLMDQVILRNRMIKSSGGRANKTERLVGSAKLGSAEGRLARCRERQVVGGRPRVATVF